MTEKLLVPDTTEPILAARTWGWQPARLVPGLPQRTELRSGSSVWGADVCAWPHDRPFHADCSRPSNHMRVMASGWERSHGEGSPAEGCTCGIYAVADPYLLEGYAYDNRVFGVVALWGRVVPATRGWRAQYAQVRSLLTWDAPPTRETRKERQERKTQNEVIEQIARSYGVPTSTTWRELTKPEEVAQWTSAKSSP